MSYPQEQEAIKKILAKFEHPVIVDLGAHRGTDEDWILAACDPEMLVMVEPDPDNYKALSEKFFPAMDASMVLKKAEQRIACKIAIANYDGLTDFYASASEGGGYGSIYKPLGGLSVSADQFHKLSNILCMRFDTLFDSIKLDHIDLLWVDLHGAEKDMIQHGQVALSKTKYLFIEFFDDRKYEGMATGSELKAMLPGWELLETFPWNMLLRNTNTT